MGSSCVIFLGRWLRGLLVCITVDSDPRKEAAVPERAGNPPDAFTGIRVRIFKLRLPRQLLA